MKTLPMRMIGKILLPVTVMRKRKRIKKMNKSLITLAPMMISLT
jgi:predicted alpha/beta hydrolase